MRGGGGLTTGEAPRGVHRSLARAGRHLASHGVGSSRSGEGLRGHGGRPGLLGRLRCSRLPLGGGVAAKLNSAGEGRGRRLRGPRVFMTWAAMERPGVAGEGHAMPYLGVASGDADGAGAPSTRAVGGVSTAMPASCWAKSSRKPSLSACGRESSDGVTAASMNEAAGARTAKHEMMAAAAERQEPRPAMGCHGWSCESHAFERRLPLTFAFEAEGRPRYRMRLLLCPRAGRRASPARPGVRISPWQRHRGPGGPGALSSPPRTPAQS